MPRRNNRIIYDTKEITLESLKDTALGGIKPECRDCLLFGYGFDCYSGDGKCVKTDGAKPRERNGDRACTHR